MTLRDLRLLPVLLLLASAAGGAADFTTYVSLGDSLAAGFSNGALLETHQANSVPALVARQAGVTDFEQPLIGEPGFPPELELLSLLPVPVIQPKSQDEGQPLNRDLPRPYNNLAVPGATTLDVLESVQYPGNRLGRFVLRGIGTQLDQARILHPTFVTLWIGDNDVVPAALDGQVVEGENLTPVDEFASQYAEVISVLKATGATIVASNIAEPWTIPFVNSIKPYVVDPATRQPVLVNGQPVPLLGTTGPLSPNAYVTLAASELVAAGVGIPAALGGTGEPLPDDVVLDPAEVATIRDHLDKDNQAIAQICQQAGIPVLDLHAIYSQFATTGVDLGGVHLSSDFLTGGLFGYDAVHPSDLGYALIANQWIAVINTTGANLAPVNVAPLLGSFAAGVARVKAQPRPAILPSATWAQLRRALRAPRR
jgi:hypothetical protein